jgi:hypothetical protein
MPCGLGGVREVGSTSWFDFAAAGLALVLFASWGAGVPNNADLIALAANTGAGVSGWS